MNEIEYVRVRIKETGDEKSIPRAKWEVSKDLFAKVQGDAVNSNGDPLPPTIVSAKSGGAKSGQQAESDKENS